jgi:hypothetical protein
MYYRFVYHLTLLLSLLLPIHLAEAQEAIDSADTVTADEQSSPGQSPAPATDLSEQVLACARDQGLSAGFQVQRSTLGSTLHIWRPHLQSIDTEEMDYVRVRVYGRGSRKGLRWDVDAYTLTGRAFIATSVYSPRPPSREAGALRRRIQKECKPGGSGT